MTNTELNQLADKIYREYLYNGNSNPIYGVDFDKRHIIEAMKMFAFKFNELKIRTELKQIKKL